MCSAAHIRIYNCYYNGVTCCVHAFAAKLIGLCCCCCRTIACCTSTVRHLKCVTFLSCSYFIHIFICGSNIATSAARATTSDNKNGQAAIFIHMPTMWVAILSRYSSVRVSSLILNFGVGFFFLFFCFIFWPRSRPAAPAICGKRRQHVVESN